MLLESHLVVETAWPKLMSLGTPLGVTRMLAGFKSCGSLRVGGRNEPLYKPDEQLDPAAYIKPVTVAVFIDSLTIESNWLCSNL